MSMRCIWCCGFTVGLCLIIGIPLLAHGGTNMPYSLTPQESVAAAGNLGPALEAKQRASAAWTELVTGAGFSFTGIGLGLLMFCYCVGFWGRIHPSLDYPPPVDDPSRQGAAVAQLQTVAVER
jgi:hypothetical protein